MSVSPSRSVSATLALLLASLVGIGACSSSESKGEGDAGRDGGGGVPDGGGTDGGMPGNADRARWEALLQALPTAANDGARGELVAAFQREVELEGGGFPIHEPGRLTFVFWDPSRIPGALSVAGDMNGWSADANPMLQPRPGFPLYVAEVAVPEPLGRTGYKFVRDGATWFADPAARRFTHDQFGELSLSSSGSGGSGPSGAGHLERWRGFEGGTLEDRTIYVYVPPEPGPHPVMYLHDGQNVFHPEAIHGGWKADDSAEAMRIDGTSRPLLMVGIPNSAARMDEYTHVTDRIGGGGTSIGGRAAEYEALVLSVKAFIDARYPTLTGASETAVVGSSLGGLISLWLAQRNPNVFGHAASLSGTIGWGSIGATNQTIIDVYRAGPPTGTRLYLDSGGGAGSGCVDLDGDGLRDDGDGADNYCENLDMRDALLGLGWQQGSTLTYRHDVGAPHNEASWAARFPAILTGFFPGPRK